MRAPWVRLPCSSVAERARLAELLDELARPVLGPGEDQHPALAAGEGGDDADPVGRGDGQQVVGDLRRLGVGVDRVPGRTVQEAAGDDVDGAVEGRGEEHPLAVGRGHVEQPPHDREEAEVGHVVRLVEDGDVHVAEVAVALLDQVGQPAGAGDHDVGPVAQRGDLRVLRRPAEDGGDLEARGVRQRGEHAVHLGGQLAGGHQDQAARAAGHRVAVGQPGDQREGEAEGLARAGLGAAENVTAVHRVGQRGGLNRERLGDALLGEHGHQLRGDAQAGEGGGGGVGR